MKLLQSPVIKKRGSVHSVLNFEKNPDQGDAPLDTPEGLPRNKKDRCPHDNARDNDAPAIPVCHCYAIACNPDRLWGKNSRQDGTPQTPSFHCNLSVNSGLQLIS
jgi:hypothetical protein